MLVPLLFLESIGTTELLVIFVVALIVFGPRKLPELGRSLGKSLGEFKRASDDFKRTWEREVEAERREQQARLERAMAPEFHAADPTPAAGAAEEEGEAAPPEIDAASRPALVALPAPSTVARGARAEATREPAAQEQSRKSDWL